MGMMNEANRNNYTIIISVNAVNVDLNLPVFAISGNLSSATTTIQCLMY
jgi:hypothetical protein